LRGETIDETAPPATGYCRRGIAELVSGKPLDAALAIIERSCATAGHSHRLAACLAIEAARGAIPSPRAQLLRAAFAEIERCLARLWTLGLTARAAGIGAAWRDALDQRELLYAALSEETGERTYWSIAVPGGVRDLPDGADLAKLSVAMDQLEPLVEAWRVTVGPRGPLGRAGIGTGRISPEQARQVRLTGLAARASGVAGDLRRDAPYGAYATAQFEWPSAAVPDRRGGDVADRMSLAVDDLATSVQLTRLFLADITPAQSEAESAQGAQTAAVASGANGDSQREGTATVEGPHGAVTIAVALTSAGTVDHISSQLPGAELIAALPDLLQGRTMSQVPMVLASLDLCPECADQ
jgi:Ni,Fe-hydrogenase III large subunit